MQLTPEQHTRVCELCLVNSPARNYSEDTKLQTALADYLEQVSGEKVNLANITHLCDSCYTKIKPLNEEPRD